MTYMVTYVTCQTKKIIANLIFFVCTFVLFLHEVGGV
jgi:hypothetical protein